MKEKKFNTWNNAPCRTIFYHVTQGSHRAALYCLYNFSELFSDELIKRILRFIYVYLRTDYDYVSFLCLSSDNASRGFMYNELINFYTILLSSNDVDCAVSYFVLNSLKKYYEE